ncbi:MAG: hypothetical protein KF866_05175 [Phycisphaeraceae bacterium]|nr:hypothetical protein [Phycisphaeraceae bacterium]MCW5754385.1 hypothetical protein [Phycisphaeraceae bacterium]
MPKHAVLALLSIAGFTAPSVAQLHPGDIVLGVDGDLRIMTGLVPPDAVDPVFPARIFTGEFGEQPNWTNDPGYDSIPGAFTAGTRLTFSIRKALRAWNGADFTTIPQERIRINFGPLGPVLTPLDDSPVPGFGVSVTSGGNFHNHYGYTLEAPAQPGLYLLELDMSGDRGLGTSDPYWIIFEQPGSGYDLGEAMQWVVRTYLDPTCPADLTGASDPDAPDYGVPDGAVDAADFFYFLDQFVAGNAAVADLTGSSDPNAPDYGVPDGVVDATDFFYFLDLFVTPCS